MKRFILTFFTFLMVLCFAQTGSATSILYDWYIDVDGTVHQATDTYIAPSIGGNITAVSGFSTISDPYDYGFDVPNALGSVTVTFNPGVAGDYSLYAKFDAEIDEWENSYFNESGGVIGSPDGTIWEDDGDIAFQVDYSFHLNADQTAIILFIITDAEPGSSYLWHTDDDTAETIYFSSSLDIRGGGNNNPVPEPSTIILFGIGILGAARIGRKQQA